MSQPRRGLARRCLVIGLSLALGWTLGCSPRMVPGVPRVPTIADCPGPLVPTDEIEGEAEIPRHRHLGRALALLRPLDTLRSATTSLRTNFNAGPRAKARVLRTQKPMVAASTRRSGVMSKIRLPKGRTGAIDAVSRWAAQ